MKLIKNPIIKTTFAAAVLTAGIVVSLIGINTLFYYPSIISNGFVITAHDYSISLNPEREEKIYYKISPYDDSLYFSPEKWEKVIERDENLKNNLISNNFERIVTNLLEIKNKAEVGFHTEGIQYDVEIKDNQILIHKKISNLKVGVNAVGNSFLFNKDDCVFDSDNRVYTDNCMMDISPTIIPATKSEGQTDVSGACFIAISNPKFSKVIVLPVEKNQKVFIDRAYKLIEIVESIPKGAKEIEIGQKIKIYENLGQFLNSKDYQCL